jgi:hypothetical protein
MSQERHYGDSQQLKEKGKQEQGPGEMMRDFGSCHGTQSFSWTSQVSRANSSPLNLFHFVSLSRRFLFLALLLALSGCASVGVGNVFSKGEAPKKLPTRIYVQEFKTPYDSFRVDRGGKDLTAFIAAEKLALAHAIVDQLNKYVVPAEVLVEGKEPPRGNFWFVTGIYDRVNQGSRALRTIVGFGAGGTKLETRVQVFSASGKKPSQFLSLLTSGGSGIAPGAWAAFTPAGVFSVPGAVANAGGASLGGLSIDRKRTAREIVATISEYCFQHGLIPERKMRRPKRLGELPAVQRPDFIVPKSGL